MNTNRLVVRLYSVVAILAAMIYLSGVAMAQPPKKDNKHDGNNPVPEHDSFDNDGSETFENSPTPTYTPELPRLQKKDDKEKEQKEKKEKKDKDDGVITIQSASPDLKYVSVVVTPVGDVAGGSGVTGQAATITVTIINANSAAAGAFRLDTWKHLPSPPNFGSIGDFSQTFAGLAGNTSLSVSYSFTMANSYGTYFPRSTVDSGSLVVETNEANNTNTGSYTVIEMATVVPPTINTVSGASVVFRGVAKNYGKKWPVNQPSAIITVPGVGSVTVAHNGTATLAGVGTFGPIVRNLVGDASLTCALAEGFGGTATVTFVCGTSTASGELRSVCLGLISPSGSIIAASSSLTFTVQTNPASVSWPAGWPMASLTPSTAGTLSSVGTTTGSATVTFFSNGTFAGIATVTFNSGSCSNYATVTVVGIEFVNHEEKALSVLGSVPAEYLNKLAADTGTNSIAQADADYLEASSFRARIRFDDPSQITERSVDLQGLDDNGNVIDNLSIPVRRTLGQPYLSDPILAYHGTLTEEARQFLSNHQYRVIHNGEVVIRLPFLPGEIKVGAVGVKGIKAIQGQGDKNRIIYLGGQAIDLRVEPHERLNNALDSSFAFIPIGLVLHFRQPNPVVMGWDFDKDFDPTVAVTLLTMGGTWFNAPRNYDTHPAEDSNSYNRPALVAGKARINELSYSEQANSPTNVQLTVAPQNIRKNYMIWAGFSGNRDLHPIQLALNPAARETATFFGPFRLRMALSQFVGDPLPNNVGVDQATTNAWLVQNFSNNPGASISDQGQHRPVPFGVDVPTPFANASGDLQTLANHDADSAATAYGCVPHDGTTSFFGLRYQMGTYHAESLQGYDGSVFPFIHKVTPQTQARAIFSLVHHTHDGQGYDLPNIIGVAIFRPAFTIGSEAAKLGEIEATTRHEIVHLKQINAWRTELKAQIERKLDPQNPNHNPNEVLDGGKYGRLFQVKDQNDEEPIFWELEAYFTQLRDSAIAYRFLAQNGTLQKFRDFWQKALDAVSNPIDPPVPGTPIDPNLRVKIRGDNTRLDAIRMMKEIWDNLPFEEMKNDVWTEQLPNNKIVVKKYSGEFDIQIDRLPPDIEAEVP